MKAFNRFQFLSNQATFQISKLCEQIPFCAQTESDLVFNTNKEIMKSSRKNTGLQNVLASFILPVIILVLIIYGTP